MSHQNQICFCHVSIAARAAPSLESPPYDRSSRIAFLVVSIVRATHRICRALSELPMSFTRFKCADDDIIACGRPSPSPANADDVSDDAGEPLRRTDRANDALFFAPNPAPPERCDAGFVENLLGVTVSVAVS